MRCGVIDIGSSSIKLIIGEEREGRMAVLEFLKNAVPIGKFTFFKERISQEIINQTVTILGKYARKLKEYEVSEVRTMATTAVREARNKDIFIDTIRRKTGLSIEVLTVGDVIYYIDAYLSHKLKDKYPLHEKNVLIAELGSGSLDIALMQKGFTLYNLGLPIGTIRLKQLMGRLEGSMEETYAGINDYIENEFAYVRRVLPNIDIDDIILIDETYAAYLPAVIPGIKREDEFFPLRFEEAGALLEQIVCRNAEEMARDFKLPREIAETIFGYANVLHAFSAMKNSGHIYILETSLAEAILANVLLKLELSPKYNKLNQLISVARFLSKKFGVDYKHAQEVAELSEKLFVKLKEYLGVDDADMLYLILAAYLHDIGMAIHNRAHHKHAEYIISALNLFRLTEEEIKIIACIARYHRRGTPAPAHLIYNSLVAEKQILVQKLSAVLKIANALDRSHKQKIKKLEIAVNKARNISIVISVAGTFVLEKDDFAGKKGLFEEITGSKLNLVVKNQAET